MAKRDARLLLGGIHLAALPLWAHTSAKSRVNRQKTADLETERPAIRISRRQAATVRRAHTRNYENYQVKTESNITEVSRPTHGNPANRVF